MSLNLLPENARYELEKHVLMPGGIANDMDNDDLESVYEHIDILHVDASVIINQNHMERFDGRTQNIGLKLIHDYLLIYQHIKFW